MGVVEPLARTVRRITQKHPPLGAFSKGADGARIRARTGVGRAKPPAAVGQPFRHATKAGGRLLP